MTRDILECTENISDETLSGWRDFPSRSDEEMAHFREHTYSCPACRQRLAEFEMVATALRREREIEPDGRILMGVRARAGRMRTLSRFHMSRRIWSGLGALAAVAALVLLFGYVFDGIAGQPNSVSTVPAGKTPIASQVVSPSPTLPPVPAVAPIVNAQTAWGTYAATTFSTKLDATHVFEVGGITPDGRSLLGYRVTLTVSGQVDQNVPAEEGSIDASTRQFTSIGLTSPAPYADNCCIADGHYLLAEQDTSPGATCGLCHLTYWSYDINTGQKYLIAKGSDFQLIQDVFLSHGLLVMWTGTGVKVADLATRSITSMPEIPASARPAAFSWPYLLYTVTTNDGASSQTHVHDLSNQRDIVLPQIDANNVGSGTVVFSGGTLFLVAGQPILPGTPSSSTGATVLYELDSFMEPGAALKPIATYKGSLEVSGANGRLVVFGGPDGLVWDRAEQRFVRLGISCVLSGNYLVPIGEGRDGTGNVPTSANVYDTRALPVAPNR